MSVEDAFSIPGRGTVVSGRVERGVLKKDSDVELVGKGDAPIKTKVTDIETFKKACDESRAGDNSGLLLRGVKREDVRRGMIVAIPGTVKAHKKFLASMYVLTKEKAVVTLVSTPTTGLRSIFGQLVSLHLTDCCVACS